MRTDRPADNLTITETRAVPAESLLFGAAAVIPFPAGAALAILDPVGTGPLAATLTVLWGAAILCFVAGVRRGVSFRTPDGPTASQLAIMFGHFVLGAAAMFVIALSIGTGSLPPAGIAATLLVFGFASLVVTDPAGAERGTMPLHFARLRPAQMLLPTLSLIVIAATR